MSRKIIGITTGTPLKPDSLFNKMNLEKRIEEYLQNNQPDSGIGSNNGISGFELDTTLTQAGKAADAKAVGDAISTAGCLTAIDDGTGIITLVWSPIVLNTDVDNTTSMLGQATIGSMILGNTDDYTP